MELHKYIVEVKSNSYIANETHPYYITDQFELAKIFNSIEDAEDEFRSLQRKGCAESNTARILEISVTPVSNISVYNKTRSNKNRTENNNMNRIRYFFISAVVNNMEFYLAQNNINEACLKTSFSSAYKTFDLGELIYLFRTYKEEGKDFIYNQETYDKFISNAKVKMLKITDCCSAMSLLDKL